MDIPIPGWTFTHWWVRPPLNIWFNIYHKKIISSGTHHIDWQKPIIFAPSHRNAFSDALCLILPTKYTDERFIYPLIRADAFGNNKAIDWILTRFHMFPVYRPQDEVNLKEKNADVFDQCYDILARRRNLLIHPEGNCIPRKRVRPFKKGLARIAFGAEEKYDFKLNVTIIPVGINYRNITLPRKGVHVKYGQPIPVADFKDQYQENAASGIRQLTQVIRQRVQELTVDLPKEHYLLSEDLLRLHKNGFSADYSERELQTHQKVGRLMQVLREGDKKSVEALSGSVTDLKSLIQQYKLSDSQSFVEKPSALGLILKVILLLILLPMSLYGWINNFIPWFLMHRLADRVKVRQFKSSARMTLGMVLFPLCYLLQTVLIFVVSGRWTWALIYLGTLPFTGLLALHWQEHLQKWRQQVRLYFLPTDARQKIEDITSDIFRVLG
jgi:1-acyl-sn-glycerol-3-phosphate acyltransferase